MVFVNSSSVSGVSLFMVGYLGVGLWLVDCLCGLDCMVVWCCLLLVCG